MTAGVKGGISVGGVEGGEHRAEAVEGRLGDKTGACGSRYMGN